MKINEIQEYYDKRALDIGNPWDACCWLSEDEAYGRYITLASHAKPNCTVLDVGCGQGDFGIVLAERRITTNYTGIDISGEMLKKAVAKCPTGKFEHISLDDYTSEGVDYVVALGPFNFRTDENQYDYLERQLRKLFELAKQKVVVTVTVNTANITVPGPEESHIFWYSPEVVHQIITSITPYYSLDTSSVALEMLICLYRA